MDDTTSENNKAGGHASGVSVAKPQNPLYKGDWEERMVRDAIVLHPLTVICCWSQDKTSGRIFYVNHRTGEQTGQRPEEMNSHLKKGVGLKGMEGEEDHQGANATLHRLKQHGVRGDVGNSDAMKISGARARSRAPSR